MTVRLVTEPPLEDMIHVARHMRERDREEIYATRWNDTPEALALDVVASGAFRWGLYMDERPVAALGAHPRWPGVWTAWAFATDDWPHVVLAATKHVKRFMIPGLINAGAHRVDALALAAHEDARKWLLSLGATAEKTLDKWGRNGESFICYVWTRNATDSPSPAHHRVREAGLGSPPPPNREGNPC